MITPFGYFGADPNVELDLFYCERSTSGSVQTFGGRVGGGYADEVPTFFIFSRALLKKITGRLYGIILQTSTRKRAQTYIPGAT